jgi:phosphate transport system permease protein
MAEHVDTLKMGGPATPARSLAIPQTRIKRRLWVDRLSRRLVTLGGVVIIASILAILLVIAGEVYPLFKPPTTAPLGTIATQIDSTPLAVGIDEHRAIAYLVTASSLRVFSVKDGASLIVNDLPRLDGASVVATSAVGHGPFAMGLSDGRLIPAEVKFNISFPEGRRQVEPDVIVRDPITVDPDHRPIRKLAYVSTESGSVTAAAVTGPKDLTVVTVKARKALIGPSTKEESRLKISLPIDGEITAAILDGRGEDVFLGTSSGQIARVDLREPRAPKVTDMVLATSGPGIGVNLLGFLIGDRTLIMGDTAGGVSSWQLLPDGGGQRLRKIYDFASHAGPVIAFAPSWRDKGFVTADASGVTHLNYGTTGRTLLTVKAEGDNLRAVILAPKADGLMTVDATGHLSHWGINNPHPEMTLRSLFGKVWYEGYPEPAYVWQSTGGTDDFEPKFSLTPLIYGTLKGTFYALLFAVPIALLSALYASQFMHPMIKGIVKPVIEIMAALPSVVLGFIAGLWLAPTVERIVPGIFLMLLVIPIIILLTLVCWRLIPRQVRTLLRPGTEVFLLIPVAILGGWLAIDLGGLLEGALLTGDYRNWLLQTLGLTYDQRNSLVVGVAMGFAVIPIIFTIAEDALSNVPAHLAAGSLALGATRWQTALRIVLPTASPGIFSAIMIGFGRAVGETMIVLMATGNTPVMDWSIFSGFRALSANIAVELPEAPEGGTLFRVLFLAALVLFVMTFIVNTVAELVRLRLRKRYRYL